MLINALVAGHVRWPAPHFTLYRNTAALIRRGPGFMWLWMKYVTGFNPKYHCTHCLKGRYSKSFSKTSNPNLSTDTIITFNEQEDFRAIYICGVSKDGYSQKRNYIHNVHIAIKPENGHSDKYVFEDWVVTIKNGKSLHIPEEDKLPPQYKQLSSDYTTCRIFRWSACYFAAQQ